MNTLSRAITARFFPSSDQYHQLQRHWSSLVNSSRKHQLGAVHHLVYCALMGKDWRKGFIPACNPRKLANGAFAGWALFRALRQIHYQGAEGQLLEPFDGLVTPAMLAQVRALLPQEYAHFYRPEQFVEGKFPFEAYLNLPPEAEVSASKPTLLQGLLQPLAALGRKKG